MQILAERYRLVELIGSGGMAVVWRAYDEVLGRPVAVKVLTSDFADEPDFRRRIRDEARAAARLAHPHVSVVHDFGEWADANDAVMPYVVMELIEGPSLHDVLIDGPLPWPRAAAIAVQIASGLAAAHARGLVHRDVKPGNVVLAPTGAKLVDFGISAIAGDARSDGDLLGTPAYVAPERLLGGRTSPAADVYALGVMLYRSVAGRMPWLTDGHTEVLLAHLHDEPDPLPAPIGDADGVPAELAALCRQCLAKEPADRPTAAEVVRTLTAIPSVSGAMAVATSDGGADASQTTILPIITSEPPITARAGPRTALDLPFTRSVEEGGARWLRSPALVVAAGVVAIAGIGAVAAAAQRGGVRPESAAVAAPPASDAACQAIYRVRSDDGARFAGELTIINSGSATLRDWTVSFNYPGGQRASGAGWRQSGNAVSFGPVATELPAGERVTYPFRGSYRDVNPMPMSFVINEVDCVARLVGAVGAVGATNGGSDPDQSGSSGPGPGSPDSGKEKDKGKGRGPKEDHAP